MTTLTDTAATGKVRRIASITVMGVALLLVACGQAASTAASSSSITLTAANFSFSPGQISVAPGQQVTIAFTNSDSVSHSFTAPSVNQDVVAGGGTTQMITFTAPQGGTISFHCRFHPRMVGTITVGSGTGGGAATQAPVSGSSGYGY